MQHKIAILINTTPFFWVLLISVLRSIFLLGFNFKEAFNGSYMDLIMICLLFLYGFLKWRFSPFSVNESEIILKKGVFLKSETHIKTDVITAVLFEKTLPLKAFSATRVIICTNSPKVSYAIYCRREQLELFQSRQEFSPPQEAKWRLALAFSLLNSSSMSGAVISAATVSQLGRVLGIKLENKVFYGIEGFGESLKLGINPLFVTLSLIIFIFWAVSFAKNMIDIGRFSISKNDDRVVIKSGIFNRYISFLNKSKINSLDIKHNLLSLIMKSGTAYIKCSGYGGGKNERSIAFPSCSDSKIDEITSRYFINFAPVPVEIKPSKKGFFGYISSPLGWVLIFSLGWLVLNTNYTFLSYVCGILILVNIWMLIVQIVAYKRSGIKVGQDILYLQHTKFFAFHTVSIKKSCIAYIEIIQNPFQRRANLCDVIFIQLSSRRKISHRIRNICYNYAKNIDL